MTETRLNYERLDENDFDLMAFIILNKCCLSVKGKLYRFVEIEFYLRSQAHNDQYTHCNDDQLLLNTFYFHKYSNGTYKSGTYKGLDLTFGDRTKGVYFGILIRSIQDVESGEIIQGPCNSVNRILSHYGVNTVMDFTQGASFNIFDNAKDLIVAKKILEPEIISAGPRIGLSAKYPEYQNRPYRYVIFKDKIKKNKRSLIDV